MPGRRRAQVDAAQAQVVEATAGFNGKHQQIVFDVTRNFYTLTAVRGKVTAEQAALDSARSLEEAAVTRKEHELATLPDSLLDAPPYPPDFHLFRVEWERAAWDNAGDREVEAHAKYALLHWRLHALLADLTGDLAHYHEAALARPDLPTSRAALGCALARQRRFSEAAHHLRRAAGYVGAERSASRGPAGRAGGVCRAARRHGGHRAARRRGAGQS